MKGLSLQRVWVIISDLLVNSGWAQMSKQTRFQPFVLSVTLHTSCSATGLLCFFCVGLSVCDGKRGLKCIIQLLTLSRLNKKNCMELKTKVKEFGLPASTCHGQFTL